jgi:hypothetical protein
MKLFVIKRSPDSYIADSFAFAVVAAENALAARYTHPARGVTWIDAHWSKKGKEYGFELWASPQKVNSRYIGQAAPGTKPGVICTSFN